MQASLSYRHWGRTGWTVLCLAYATVVTSPEDSTHAQPERCQPTPSASPKTEAKATAEHTAQALNAM